MATDFASSPLVLVLPTFLLAVLLQLVLDPVRVFTRLRCYHAATSNAAAAAGGRPVRPRGKKGAKQQDNNDYDLGGAESLIVTPLSRRLAGQLKHLDAFNNLVRKRTTHACLLHDVIADCIRMLPGMHALHRCTRCLQSCPQIPGCYP